MTMCALNEINECEVNMNKDRVYMHLDYNNGVEQVLLNGGRNSMPSDVLLKFLRESIKTKELLSVKKIKSDKTTKYIFDSKSYDEDKEKYIKGSIVLTVKNSEKKYVARTISSLDDICTITVQIKKINRARLAAKISVGIILLTTVVPVIAKGLENYAPRATIEENEEYIPYTKPTEEEIKLSIDKYYKNLEQKAKTGNEDAIKEYNKYLLEQQLIEQRENWSKTR